MLTRFALALLTLSASAAAAPAFAQTQGGAMTGVAIIPDYEGADSVRITPFAAARIHKRARYVALEGLTLRANALDEPRFELGPVATYTFGRDDDLKSKAVARLGTIDDAVELGAFAAARFGEQHAWRIAVQATQDVSGVHDGWQASASLGYAMPLNAKWRLGAETSATLVGDDYAGTYFSISRAGAAASGLAPYIASGGLKDAGLSVMATYAATPTWSVNAFAGYRRLLGDAADSPIVKDRGSPDQFSGGLAIRYVF